MQRYNTQWEHTYDTMSAGTVYQSVEWKADSAMELRHCVLIEALNGAPTAAALAVKFQVAPYQYKGQPLDYQTTADGFPWQDVAAADTMFGNCLMDGDWPASLADQTLVGRKYFMRRFRLGHPSLVRAIYTPTFTGGSSPSFSVSTSTTLLF